MTALSVVANGAEADTQSEILDVISVNSIKDLNQSYKNLQNKIAVNYKINGRIFSDSNLILIDNKLADKGINRSYKNVVENIYKSDIRTADFKNNLSNEKRKITTWVDDKTKHFIPNYQSIVTEDTIMDILNVVYFKGDWQMPFEAENTYKSTFTNQDKSTNSIKMMNKSFKKSIKYYEDKKYKSIELPYKLNGENKTIASMYLILPVDESDLNIAENWNNESMKYKTNFLNQVKSSKNFSGKVFVKLPKFELDIENKLVNNLKTLGINKAFTNDAEFLKMINNASLKIDDVKHRAKVKVDEKGTEAAAITEVEIMATAAAPMPEVIKEFYADRPFLFMIVDVESNTTLFTGIVNKL